MFIMPTENKKLKWFKNFSLNFVRFCFLKKTYVHIPSFQNFSILGNFPSLIPRMFQVATQKVRLSCNNCGRIIKQPITSAFQPNSLLWTRDNYALNDTFRCRFLLSPNTRITLYSDDNTPLIGGTYTGGDSVLDFIDIFGDLSSKNLSFNADRSSKMLLNFGRYDVPLFSGIDRKSMLTYLASYSTKIWVLLIMWIAS